MIKISHKEFKDRINRMKDQMKREQFDLLIIYGDEYRRENLRYVSNFWPLFERGALVVPYEGEPILLAAPEGENVCKEMSAWPNISLIPDFACVTVPDDIEYPHANYTSFGSLFADIQQKTFLRKVGIVGADAMARQVYAAIVDGLAGCEVSDANAILFESRLLKSENEIACLKEAARIADVGYKALMAAAEVGKSELELSAAAHQAAFEAGAEAVPFCLVSSGKRVETIIGRATGKRIEDGDMVMAALAIQYEGYIATINFPFVVGTISERQRQFIDLLLEANDIAISKLRPGGKQSELVKAVKEHFRNRNVSQYDLYPPLHGCGVAEAESPYPNESTEGVFAPGMTVNTDISLFGHPDGSNRIEECFVITKDGYERMSRLVGELSRQWKETGNIDPAIVQ